VKYQTGLALFEPQDIVSKILNNRRVWLIPEINLRSAYARKPKLTLLPIPPKPDYFMVTIGVAEVVYMFLTSVAMDGGAR